MASFSNTISLIEAVFDSTAWTDNNITIYPSNYRPKSDLPSEYTVLEILPSKMLDIQYGEEKFVGGMIIVQIYVPVNSGTRRVHEIGDILDSILERQYIGEVQTSSSYIDIRGNDTDDPSMFRGDYTLSFNSF